MLLGCDVCFDLVKISAVGRIAISISSWQKRYVGVPSATLGLAASDTSHDGRTVSEMRAF